MYLGDLPIWSQPFVQLLAEHNQFALEPDQMIINEYHPGQGIAHHIDCEPCFGDRIASLSLGSSCLMNFLHTKSDQVVDVLLEPNSLLIIRDEARYDWKHGIPARKTDTVNGKKYARSRRVSITFRKVTLNT